MNAACGYNLASGMARCRRRPKCVMRYGWLVIAFAHAKNRAYIHLRSVATANGFRRHLRRDLRRP